MISNSVSSSPFMTVIVTNDYENDDKDEKIWDCNALAFSVKIWGRIFEKSYEKS